MIQLVIRKIFLKKVSANYIKKFRIIALYNSNQRKFAFYKEDLRKTTEHFLLFNKKSSIWFNINQRRGI